MSQKKIFFFIRQNLSFFLLLTDEKRKKRRWWEERKNDRSDAMFRRIDPVPSFFNFSVTSFTSSWLHRRLMVFKFSNFCIVFFIFQRVQSLRGSRRVEWLHVDGYLSEIKLELVIDNPILFQCCLWWNKIIRSKFFDETSNVFFVVEMEMEIWHSS